MIDYLKTEKLKTGVSQSTVNHVLAFLRSLLNRARTEWEWIDNVPTIKLFPVKKQRLRWLTHFEVERLLKELPEHLNAMARFSLATGLRESNVTHLTWQQIDLSRKCMWIYADESKSGNDMAFPLNDLAIEVLLERQKMRAQVGIHINRVFTYKGNPVDKASTLAFRKALKRAGITNACWHTLRHTFASWHRMNGTPLDKIKELGGWASYEMVFRYAHLSSDHLQEFASNSVSKKAIL
jgi:integrase